MANFHIEDQLVGPDESAFVIAEAGSNHNGELEIAKELIDVAAEAGADAVKFQVFKANELYVEDSGVDSDLEDEKTIHDVISTLELPREWISTLYDYCEKRDIIFMATPFDEGAINALEDYVPAYKIASSSVTHLPFLEKVAASGKPILLSTGFHNYSEVSAAVEKLRKGGVEDLVLLHCVGAYPTPLDEINVRAMDTLHENFSVPVGLSDHTLDATVAPCAAVSRDAAIIEKHFTLDKSMEGPDHSFALEPDELEQMISAIRRFERALGGGSIDVRDVEKKSYEVARRSVHASTTIERGEEFSTDNTAILRPGKKKKGIPPKEYAQLLGEEAAREISKDEGISLEDIR